MEATIQSNQMDVDKEEERPNPEVSNLPQERHIWRMPELPPIPQGLNHLQVAAVEIYQSQYKNWFRAAKEEEWEICPSLWQGAMNSYLRIKSFLGQEKTIELLGGWSLLSCKNKVKKLKNWLKNQSLLSIYQKKELEMTPALETEGPVGSTSSKPAPEVSKDKPKVPQTLPTRVQDSQIGAFSHGQCVQYGQDSYGIYSQGAGKDEQNISTQIIDEIHFVQSNIDVNIGNLDAKLTQITLDINDLKKNDKQSAEKHKSVITTLKILTNTCDRIESKYQAQIDKMEDLSILNINDQLKILKDHVLAIAENTNQFATHLAKSDSERQKLKNEIIANVEQIHKNYEPHMPRHSTPLTLKNILLKENITAFFEVTKTHTHLPQYSEDCHNLINIQDARMCKTKPARGKSYMAGASCITSILMNGIEAKVNLDTGAFCTCVGKDYLQVILPEWENHLLPIEGVQFSSSSNNMYPLGILDTNIVFPHPTGSIRMKKDIVLIDNCTSQHINLENDYLNLYGIYINNHKDRYFKIGDNKRQKFSFSNMPKQISVVSSLEDTYKGEFVSNQLVEAKINPSLSPKMRNELIDVLYTYNNAFSSDNEPVGAIKGNEVDITVNIDRPYPSVLSRPAYPASPRAREALEKHIQELIQLGVLRKLGNNEEVEVKTPVIIAWHNEKSRMVGDFRELNTYTVPDRYPIPRIQETLTQLSKSKYITSMDALKGFHQNVLTPKAKKLLRIITHCGIYEYLKMPFGIKNAPSHYQRMMNTIFPTELSEGWLIIYIDDIIICSDSWSLHLERLSRVLHKVAGVNMKISLKKCNFFSKNSKHYNMLFLV
ncbi:hypothetical protein O181_064825 [Austropuccinia psidii MF-1]|uniref:Reverse transcriptase domain-containing protein n=1 Tax=Austropuccinia psidii MF-1 TaxID=1389203 RepID=A0A9Q3ETX9_9BASI|nr:hypothetical protein [Austropuccinia psidii MF-1]